MKKSLALLSAIILLGAGCLTTNTSTEVETSATVAPTAGISTSIGTSVNTSVTDSAGTSLSVSLAMNVDMTSGNFFFSPKVIKAKAGQAVDVKIVANEGFHTFVIDAIKLNQTVKAGGTISFTAPTTPGSYPFYCSVGNHRAMGMEGTLIVE